MARVAYIAGDAIEISRRKADSQQEETFMSGLGDFHHAEEPVSKGSRITHWIILAVVIVGMAAFAVQQGMFDPETKQTAQSYPRAL